MDKFRFSLQLHVDFVLFVSLLLKKRFYDGEIHHCQELAKVFETAELNHSNKPIKFLLSFIKGV